MENWIYIVSVIASLLLGLKLKSNCCGKMCEFSIEKQQNNDEILQSIKITKRSKVKPISTSGFVEQIRRADSSSRARLCEELASVRSSSLGEARSERKPEVSSDVSDNKSDDSFAEELKNLPEIK